MGKDRTSFTSEETSSIGEDSDEIGREEDGNEVQSVYKEIVPRRGVSKFYDGKSKSFPRLASVPKWAKEIAKPENKYSTRRWEVVALKRVIAKRQQMSKSNSIALAMAFVRTNESNCTTSAIHLPPLHPRATQSQQ